MIWLLFPNNHGNHGIFLYIHFAELTVAFSIVFQAQTLQLCFQKWISFPGMVRGGRFVLQEKVSSKFPPQKRTSKGAKKKRSGPEAREAVRLDLGSFGTTQWAKDMI